MLQWEKHTKNLDSLKRSRQLFNVFFFFFLDRAYVAVWYRVKLTSIVLHSETLPREAATVVDLNSGFVSSSTITDSSKVVRYFFKVLPDDVRQNPRWPQEMRQFWNCSALDSRTCCLAWSLQPQGNLRDKKWTRKTITKTSASAGCVPDLNEHLNGWFNKCLVEVPILVDISHPLCTVLMQHRSCFSNRCALRVSAESFKLFSVQWAIRISTKELWLIHHVSL